MSASGNTVWQQERRINVGGTELKADGNPDDLDIEITVRAAKKKGLSFEARIYNLNKSATWDPISLNDPIDIEMGWRDGTTSMVVAGTVDEMTYRDSGNDTVYNLIGQDRSRKRARTRLSHTFQDQSPTQMAQWIGNQIGVSTGMTIGSPTIPGFFTIRDDKPARYWLDQLASEASERTNQQWMWNIHDALLDFMPKQETRDSAIEFSYDSTLLSINAAKGKSDNDTGDELDFSSLMLPQLRKDSIVAVNTEEYSGAYKVTDITHVSNTVTGDHLTEGTITPADSNYTVAFPGTPDTGRPGLGGITQG